MRPILTISEDEINEQLLRVIKLLFSTNVDQIIIQREKTIAFEDFVATQKIDDIMAAFKQEGYSSEFLADLEEGLKTSTVKS
jgi:phosphoribosylaminoimidazole (AIR) synthetase